MTAIPRCRSNARLSRIVVHKRVVHVAGIAANDLSGDAQAQTNEILEKIDAYLVSVGSSKSRLLSAQVWLRDSDRDFAGMNAAWEAWVAPDVVPTRAGTALAAPGIRMEIVVTATLE